MSTTTKQGPRRRPPGAARLDRIEESVKELRTAVERRIARGGLDAPSILRRAVEFHDESVIYLNAQDWFTVYRALEIGLQTCNLHHGMDPITIELDNVRSIRAFHEPLPG